MKTCITLLLTGIAILIGLALWDDYAHPCIRSHREMVYHAPNYIMVGKMMMPMGGGTWEDDVCDERK